MRELIVLRWFQISKSKMHKKVKNIICKSLKMRLLFICVKIPVNGNFTFVFFLTNENRNYITLLEQLTCQLAKYKPAIERCGCFSRIYQGSQRQT